MKQTFMGEPSPPDGSVSAEIRILIYFDGENEGFLYGFHGNMLIIALRSPSFGMLKVPSFSQLGPEKSQENQDAQLFPQSTSV